MWEGFLLIKASRKNQIEINILEMKLHRSILFILSHKITSAQTLSRLDIIKISRGNKNLYLEVRENDFSKVHAVCYCSTMKKGLGHFIQDTASMKFLIDSSQTKIHLTSREEQKHRGFEIKQSEHVDMPFKGSITQLVMRSRVYFKKSDTKTHRLGVLLYLNFHSNRRAKEFIREQERVDGLQ